ncbi:hypothetical protein D9M71_445310 [compost metagenome]
MHHTVVDPTGQAPESLAKAAELTHQRQLVPLAQLQAIADTQLAELVGGDFADPVQFAHRQTTDKVLDLVRCDDKQAVGLFPVTGNLGQKLVRRHTRRHGDMQLVGDPAPDVLGDSRCTACEMRAVRHIEVRLIERERLDDLGVIAKNRVDFPGRFSIGIHAWLDDGQVRAQLQGMPGGHRRTHPVRSRLIIAGGDHPAPVRRPTYRQWFTGQAWVVAHLDGCIEAVTIDVDDLALGHSKAVFMARKRRHGVPDKQYLTDTCI